MALDIERATFVQTSLRYEIAVDNTVKSTFNGARTIEIATNITTTSGANAAANEILSFYKTPARSFDVDIAGTDTVNLTSLSGSLPTFTATFSDYAVSAVAMLPARIEINYATNSTKLVLRG